MTLKYYPGATDGEGREYLTSGAGSIRGHFIYRSTEDDWHTLPSTFSGFGRDGYSYYRGERLSGNVLDFPDGLNKFWGTYDSDIPGYPRRHYDYSWYDSWVRSNDRMTPTIVGDAVRLGTSSLATTRVFYNILGSCYRWKLQGDFDIQCDISNMYIEANPAGGFQIGLQVFAGFYNHSGNTPSGLKYMYFASGLENNFANTFSKWGFWGGDSNTTLQLYNKEEKHFLINSGKLRMVRSGNTYTSYYDFGTGWVEGKTFTAGRKLSRDRVYVALITKQNNYSGSGSRTAYCDVNNFTINSGTVVYKSGWALETANADRGSRSDFPENALILWTATELSIIDLDNDLLWWRMKGTGTQNYLYQSPYNQSIIESAFMKNGILYVSVRSTIGGSYCVGNLTIDFTVDGAVQYSNYNYGATFGSYAGEWGEPEALNYRNASFDGLNYWGPFKWDSAYHTSSSNHYTSHVYRESGYVYRAFGMLNGAQVFKFEEKKYEKVPSNTHTSWSGSSAIRSITFDDYGQLLFADSSNIYKVDKTTWQGGDFSATTTISSPGTRSIDAQYRIVTDDNNLYVARNEGIYSCPLDGSTFSLLYGKSGSGATYEILSDYDRISCIKTVEGYIVISTRKQDGDYIYRVIVINNNEISIDQDVTSSVGNTSSDELINLDYAVEL